MAFLSRLLFLFLGIIESCYADFSGFYVGTGAGASLFSSTHNFLRNNSVSTSKLKSNAGILGGDLGYIHNPQGSRFLFGGDFYGQLFMGGKASNTLQSFGSPTQGNVSLSHKHALGGAFLTGMLINPKTALYVKLGYEKNSFSVKYSALTFQNPDSLSYKKSVIGMAPGGGALYALTDHVLLGGEYTRPFLKDITIQNSSGQYAIKKIN